jgi:ligand-binding SRPBCC domain-containing protein
MNRQVLTQEQFIPRPRSEVFRFFSEAQNLELLTPDLLQFRILTPLPIEMKEGSVIDYALRIHGVPVRWQTRIDRYEPDHCFVDVALRSPYRHWHHLHEFTEVSGGTLMRDVVHYEVPLGSLGRLVGGPYVRRMLDRIFSFRRQVVDVRFGVGRAE